MIGEHGLPDRVIEWWRTFYGGCEEKCERGEHEPLDLDVADPTVIMWERCANVNEWGNVRVGSKRFPRTDHGRQVVSVCGGAAQ